MPTKLDVIRFISKQTKRYVKSSLVFALTLDACWQNVPCLLGALKFTLVY